MKDKYTKKQNVMFKPLGAVQKRNQFHRSYSMLHNKETTSQNTSINASIEERPTFKYNKPYIKPRALSNESVSDNHSQFTATRQRVFSQKSFTGQSGATSSVSSR